ncbi:MAG: hypothetical protein ACE5DL_04060 [Nitrosopumilaceae archaeon]
MDERVLRVPYIQIFDDFFVRKMPDESCRQCGGSLIDFAQCAQCKKVISMMCKSCRNKTMEQFHSECLQGLNRSDKFPIEETNYLPFTTLA